MRMTFVALAALAAGAVTATSAASGAVETKQRVAVAVSATHGVVTRDSGSADSEPLSRAITDVGSSVAAKSTDSAGRTIYYTDGRWYYANATPVLQTES